MNRIVVYSRVGADGVLQLTVPMGLAEADREVEVTIEPAVPQREELTEREEWIALCSVVLAELLFGAHHSASNKQTANLALVARLQQRFVSLPFDDSAAAEYGRIRAHLAAQGTLIGPNDLMIASIALAGGLIVVTHNTRESGRVPGLRLEDWQ